MNKNFKTAVVFNDIHFPYESRNAVSILIKTFRLVKPEIVIANGDITDWDTFSRHTIFSPPKCHWTDTQFLKNSEKEYKYTNIFLDKIEEILPKSTKVWLYSNHDQWLFDFIDKDPGTREKLFGFESRLNLKNRGYITKEYNKFYKLGKLWITHGMYAGQNPTRKHLNAVGNSVLFGHVHNMEVSSQVTAGGETRMAWANGCLLHMETKYMKLRPHNWSHGFSIVYLFNNGDFQVNQVRIEKGRAVVNGELIIGDTDWKNS